MTLAEFKAWFEGYTETIDGAPTIEQFKRIKTKLAETEAVGISAKPPYYTPNMLIGVPAPQPYTTCSAEGMLATEIANRPRPVGIDRNGMVEWHDSVPAKNVAEQATDLAREEAQRAAIRGGLGS